MRTQRGLSLILSLGVLTALLAILAAAASTQQIMVRSASNRIWERRARLAGESGIQRALATLAAQSTSATLQSDDWFTLGTNGDENFVVGDGTFRAQIIDAASLVNLNTATQAQLETMPLTSEQIDSLLDWREAGTTPRAEGGKDEYYQQLPTPYNAKLRPLTTIDELLLVKGFTPQAIFEQQTNTVNTTTLPQRPDGTAPVLYDLVTVDSTSGNVGSGGQTLPNISTAQPQQLQALGLTQAQITRIQVARPTTYAALLPVLGSTATARRVINAYGVTTGATRTGKIDVNTASDITLATVPSLPPDVATAMVTRQTTGFQQLGDLFDVPGYTLQVAALTMDLFATNSHSFLIRVMGTSGQTHVSIEATIVLENGSARIARITQLPYADMSTRWGWNATTTTDTVLKEAAKS